MPNTAKIYNLTKNAPCFGPARVLAVDESANLVQVRLLKTTDRPEVWCRPVLSLAQSLVSGDEVLVMGERINDIYIVDLLARSRTTDVKQPRAALATETKTGAFVVIDTENSNADHEVIKVFSNQKKLVFEYDAKSEKARIFAPSGDLDLMTETGDIALNAAGKIRLNAEKIDVTGRSAVSLGVSRLTGDSGASLALDSRKVKIDSPEIKISAGRGSLFFTELRYAGEKIFATAGYIQIMARRLETAAKTILEKADNVYRKVKQLSQLQAGRKRVLVDETFYVKSRRSVMKSDKNFKVKSDKIHLG
ncbi:MAG: hypothetical protein B6I22_00855 [Desulfobacteraceae bacterium 4572_123]|nr:MAG: hypothetical protein B6I22_00855 [Desulfobacteraceae bacterium 4572_123]